MLPGLQHPILLTPPLQLGFLYPLDLLLLLSLHPSFWVSFPNPSVLLNVGVPQDISLSPSILTLTLFLYIFLYSLSEQSHLCPWLLSYSVFGGLPTLSLRVKHSKWKLFEQTPTCLFDPVGTSSWTWTIMNSVSSPQTKPTYLLMFPLFASGNSQN